MVNNISNNENTYRMSNNNLIDYANIGNHTNELNNFLAENSENFVNGGRLLNQWTRTHTDNCDYQQQLRLSTQPLKYFVNSLNNISGVKTQGVDDYGNGSTRENFANVNGNTNENSNGSDYLSFTPIGNASQVNIRSEFERPIPSTLSRSAGSVFTIPYATSPNLGMTSNVNNFRTDEDLTLKTGLGLRSRNNQAQLSSMEWPTYGDIHARDIEVTHQNAGQFYDERLGYTTGNNPSLKRENFQNIHSNASNGSNGSNASTKDISQNVISRGIGVVSLINGLDVNMDTYNMQLNLQQGKPFNCTDVRPCNKPNMTIL